MMLPAIASLVPHAGSMLLLDRVISVDAENLCAEVVITSHSLFFDGVGVGSWVGVEYMAQAIAAHAGYAATQNGAAVKIGFLLGSRRYQASVPMFMNGSCLHISVQRVLQSDNGLGAFECRISEQQASGDVPLASATITVFQPDNVQDFLQGKSS